MEEGCRQHLRQQYFHNRTCISPLKLTNREHRVTLQLEVDRVFILLMLEAGHVIRPVDIIHPGQTERGSLRIFPFWDRTETTTTTLDHLSHSPNYANLNAKWFLKCQYRYPVELQFSLCFKILDLYIRRLHRYEITQYSLPMRHNAVFEFTD